MTNMSGEADEWLNFLSAQEAKLVGRTLSSWEFAMILWGVVTEHPSERLPGTNLYVCGGCGVGLDPAREENGRPLNPDNIAEEVEQEIAKHWGELLAYWVEVR